MEYGIGAIASILGMMVIHCFLRSMCRTGYDLPDLKSVGDGVVLNNGEMQQNEAEVAYASVTDRMDYGKHDI